MIFSLLVLLYYIYTNILIYEYWLRQWLKKILLLECKVNLH